MDLQALRHCPEFEPRSNKGPVGLKIHSLSLGKIHLECKILHNCDLVLRPTEFMSLAAVSFTLRIQCRQCSSRLSDSCMADLLGASIPERGAASTLQELLLRSQPLPRSPLRQYSSSSCSEAAAMAAADSLLTPLESCKNGVHSSWHQVVRQRQVSSGQHGHHRLWCGQPPSGAASAASRRPLPRGKRNVWGAEDII